jgi:tetratricopeptide (TPR) repeat protein
MQFNHLFKSFSISLLTLGLSASLAAAVPSSGRSIEGQSNDNMTTSAPNKSPKAKKCKRNETTKTVSRNGKRVSICVKLKAGNLSDNELYQNARSLADTGDYEWALDHLKLVSDQNNPEVLNYTGYANRKAGRLETGISYYHQALAINPNYVQAREYLGEAYVLAGRIDLAKFQLQEIAARCGVNCETYRSLAIAIDTAN